MSNFLEKLKTSVFDCEPSGEIINGRLEVLTIINSLGENARRMLEIGVLQDELVKLGFKPNSSNPSKWDNFINFATNTNTIKRVNIFFGLKLVNIFNWTYSYDSPTWQQDVLTKVKELINHD